MKKKNLKINLYENENNDDNYVCSYSLSGYVDNGKNKSLLKKLENNSNHYKLKLDDYLCSLLNYLKLKINSLNSNHKNLINLILFSSGFVEKSPFKTDSWINILKLLVFNDEIKKIKPNQLNLSCSNIQIYKCIINLKIKYNFILKTNYILLFKKLYLSKSIKKLLPIKLKAIIYLFLYFINRISICNLNKPEWHSGPNSIFFLSTTIHLDKNKCESGYFYSKQWENLPSQLIESGYKLNWLQLLMYNPLIPNNKTVLTWFKRFNSIRKHQEVHALLDQYLNLNLLFLVLRDWILLVYHYYFYFRLSSSSIKKLNNGWLWPLIKNTYKDSWIGPVAVQNLIWIHLFEKILSSLPTQPIGFYLFENQCQERLFIHTWKKYGHGKLVGVAHSTIRHWDLRYYDTNINNIIDTLPQPDLIAVNGKESLNNLSTSDYPIERCYPVEALRYQYLNQINILKSNIKKNCKIRLLVLGDLNYDSTKYMMLQLEKSYSHIKHFVDIWIKDHPGNPIKISDYPKIEAISKSQFLFELLPQVNVVLASVFTSSSLDAYCFGIPVINFLDPDKFNFSPLRGNSSVKFINTSSEIVDLLTKNDWIYSIPSINASNYFWFDDNLIRWKKLVKKIIHN